MSETKHHVDYAILGGGMAGLTVASALAPRLEEGERLVVVEPREDYGHDRTFCYWDVAPIEADQAVKHRWKRWSVRSGGRTAVVESENYSYSYVPADAFYQNALTNIAKHSGAEVLLQSRALNVTDGDEQGARVYTDKTSFDARWVFDTRPRQSLIEAAGTLQHFVGWHLRFDRPVFDETTVTLMDFDVPQDKGLHFMYVLPFSKNEALVESTFFSPTVLEHAEYESYIRDYLCERFDVDAETLENAEIIRVERGVVPMSPATIVPPKNPAWHLLGTPGGFVRPATGYCFHATGRFAVEHIDWLMKPRTNVPALRGKGLNWLDSVLLAYLDRAPEQAPDIFLRLFEHVDSDALVRFLSNVGTPSDVLDVMRAMPVWPFVKEAMHQSFVSPTQIIEPSHVSI
ncbi:MAG: hypothetical protein HOI23_00810 [Deltaproteobacteria bacterium]|jgi:lycopene beta-cyclase|nr:hypothetical protein [Deltaproteobacteria bacterium]MBT6435529.1 hypothetical protein [Deltaproteobacteria bacterium]MBT6489567.1 hypothetical protein [Deltaproteobacteria bacterium]